MRFLRQCAALVGLAASAVAMESALPEDLGLDSAKLEEVTEKLARLVDDNIIPGAAFMVARSGKWAYYGVTGYQDRQLRVPMKLDTICRLMSMSKPLSAGGIMKAVEDGLIDLDANVWKYLPEWENAKVWVNGSQTADGKFDTEPMKKPITIRSLLLHTSGLSYGFGFGEMTPVDNMYPNQWDIVDMTLPQFSEKFAQIPLLYQPQTHWKYSFGYDLLGAVLEKVTGMPADQYMKKMIFDPLRMADTGFYVPAEKIGRYSTTYTKTQNNPQQMLFRPRVDYVAYRKPTFTSLGAGIVSTARDYARYAQMLLNGGVLDGVRVLKQETIDTMWQNYLPDSMLPMFMNGWTSNQDTGFGFGFTIASNQPVNTIDWTDKKGDKRIGTIGWGGGANTNFQVSADNDLVVTYMTQMIGGSDSVFQEVVMSGINAAIIRGSPRKDAGGISTYLGPNEADNNALPPRGKGNGGGNIRGYFGGR